LAFVVGAASGRGAFVPVELQKSPDESMASMAAPFTFLEGRWILR
jgi:hypothetical protein